MTSLVDITQRVAMLFARVILGVFRSYFRRRKTLVWENALLRYQLGVLGRTQPRPILRRWDRPILIWLTRRVANWKNLLCLVQPDTLVRWHRKGFALLWNWKTGGKGGRPTLPREVVKLIRQIAFANPRWGAPRIHGELLKLGIEISQASVEKYLKRWVHRKPPTQKWKTFLRNQRKGVVAMDFFLVPTIRMKLLYVLVVLSHERREILHVAVTRRPSRIWAAQQLRELYPFEDFPKFVLHDRDRHFWGLSRLGFREIITAHKCPWQNAYVERVIGSIRRECTDHVIPVSERHLRNVLLSYKEYYNRSRTHLALNKDSPIPRPTQLSGNIISIPRVGGLHHEFRRAV